MITIVVGVGCGPGMLTEDAIEKIRQAKDIYGSSRAIEIAKPFISPQANVKAVQDYSRLNELPEEALLLSTGDPMLAGLGHLGLEVVPGISSMQCAFARIRLPMAKAVVIDAHGHGKTDAIDESVFEVNRGRIPFVLTDPDFDLKALVQRLKCMEIDCKMIVCENLGYPNEVISFGTPDHPPETSSKLYSLLLVKM